MKCILLSFCVAKKSIFDSPVEKKNRVHVRKSIYFSCVIVFFFSSCTIYYCLPRRGQKYAHCDSLIEIVYYATREKNLFSILNKLNILRKNQLYTPEMMRKEVLFACSEEKYFFSPYGIQFYLQKHFVKPK